LVGGSIVGLIFVVNDLLDEWHQFLKNFESAFEGSPVSKTRNFLCFSAGEKGKEMLELFFSAGVDNLLFEEFFKLFFVRKVDEFIEFLFINGKSCFFMCPFAKMRLKSSKELNSLSEVSFEEDFPEELQLFGVGKEMDLKLGRKYL
jgi:hypothetical protein